MNCPRTGKEMKEFEMDGVKVDVSTGCGGVFFDNFELDKFDEKDETAGDELMTYMEMYANDIDLDQRLDCPKCSGITMQRHFFSVGRKVEIDECPGCGSVWLDPGELLTIRETYPSEEEREKAAEAYIKEVLDNPEMNALKEKGEEGLARARKFAKAFRFICPSNYIKGKQAWGAF